MLVQEYISALYPSMLTVSGYDAFISMAEETLDSNYFGDLYDQAVALKAMHLYELNRKRGGESGFVTQKVEGRTSISFATNNAKLTSDLQLTSYGLQLLQLIKKIRPGVVVGSSDIMNTT